MKSSIDRQTRLQDALRAAERAGNTFLAKALKEALEKLRMANQKG